MIKALGTHRGYKVFYQNTKDFEGIYTEPGIGHYLGQTFEQAKATIDAMLDEEPDVDMPFDVDLAGELSDGKW